jgi:hypothetical protein
MLTFRHIIVSVVAAYVFMPIATEAALSGEYKSQRWPGSKIVFFEDGTGWFYAAPAANKSYRPEAQGHKFTYKEESLDDNGKKIHVVCLVYPSGAIMAFELIDGDLLQFGRDDDRFVKDSFWKRLTE